LFSNLEETMNKRDEQIDILKNYDLDTLIDMLRVRALKDHGGHFTILGFTNGYKVALGTPSLDSNFGREQVSLIEGNSDMRMAIIIALVDEQAF